MIHLVALVFGKGNDSESIIEDGEDLSWIVQERLKLLGGESFSAVLDQSHRVAIIFELLLSDVTN